MPYELPALVAVEKALIAYGINKEPTQETLDMLKPHFLVSLSSSV
jgi:hypothetical protein